MRSKGECDLNMKYKYFLNETGDHGLNYVDKNFPIFLLWVDLILHKPMDAIRKLWNYK